MKKQIIFLVLALMGLTVMAKPVEPATAVQVARHFALTQLNAKQRAFLGDEPFADATVVYAHPMPESGRPAMYVVNLGSAFVIVAADDVAHPILGYNMGRPWPTASNDGGKSNNRAITQSSNLSLPSQVSGFLDDLANQINAALQQNVAPDRGTASEWQQLSGEVPMYSSSNIPDSVGPLLTTTWDQGQYYNALCPEDTNGPAGHAYTGCVATAMAQIINYWGYPVHGRGFHSYNISNLDPNSMCSLNNLSGYGTLYADYENTTYDYANMPNSLDVNSTLQEVQAVAKLMYYCGVGVNMFYDANSSGAYEEDIRGALISYFGFSSSLGYANRYQYTNVEWEDSLRSNINRYEPVIYTGTNSFSAHAFVLDGYNQAGFFHFNFGWSGSCDGWFLTTAIDVNFGFNNWQSAFMGIRPDSVSQSIICHKTMQVENRDIFKVSRPIDLLPLRGGSKYRATNELTGTFVNINIVPEDSLDQVVLDVIYFGEEQSVLIYDGLERDSILRVLETRGYSERNRIVTWQGNYWTYYGFTPSDTVLRQMAGMDFSPVVSTRHGFTIVVNSYGGMSDGFLLRVSNASDCRMVSNVFAEENDSGVFVSWTENGNATQWQLKIGDTLLNCDSTNVLLTDLEPNTSYTIEVRAVCGDGIYSPWNSMIINKRDFWKDAVTSEPEGYDWDGDTIRIASAEGLAWLARCVDSMYINGIDNYQFPYSVISIENNLDLSGYLWSPIRYWFGNVTGNGHVISNADIYTSEYGGIFEFLFHARICDLGFVNTRVNSISSAGVLAGSVQDCQVINCWTNSHIINTGNGQGGGLIGNIWESQLTNCYAYGDIYSQFGYGGLVGYSVNSQINNCVSRVGESYVWAYRISPPEYRGVIAGNVQGGIFSNCFSDICAIMRDNITLPLNLYSLFLGNYYYSDEVNNLVAFNIAIDSLGLLIPETAVNYTLGDNMNVITALNNYVTNLNSPEYRVWVRDSITHLPVFGDFYEVICPNVSNLTAENILYNDEFAVALSWQENGDASEWQIKYNIVGASEDSAVVINSNVINDTIVGLRLRNDYVFYVKPVCDSEDNIGWGQPLNFYVDKIRWIGVVTSQPAGFLEDGNGSVTISSPEGLAWLAKIGFNYRYDTIFIVNNLDMGAYRWTPIGQDCFTGVVEGYNHTVSNLYCCEKYTVDDYETRSIGLFGYVEGAYFNNINITNCYFSGYKYVGGLFGRSQDVSVNNCHTVNIVVKGMYSVGGLGGTLGISSEGVSNVKNCSSTGVVYGNQNVGGFLAVTVEI